MRVLMFGGLPPDLAVGVRTEATNLRSWQLLAPLVGRHQCCLVAWGNNEPHPRRVEGPSDNLECWVLNFSRRWIPFVRRLAERFQPDAMIGVRYRGAMYGTRLGSGTPLWIDAYGDLSVENQGYAHANPRPSGMWSASWIERVMYTHGDVFSACCQRQKYAVIGKLGLLGRLTGATFGYEFVHAIPPGIETRITAEASDRLQRADVFSSVRGLETVPPDAVIVLWCGSYNTWTDLDFLFEGVTMAMGRNRRIHYVATGSVAGIQSAHRRFTERIASTPFAARFHQLEWQPYAVVQQLQAISDIGISIDAEHYEVLLGTRTRLIEMASHGLALVSTAGTELAEALSREGALSLLPDRSAGALADALTALAENADQRSAMSRRATQVAARDYSFELTTSPLQEWVNAPTVAPDKRERTLSNRMYFGSRLTARKIAWSAFGDLG